MTHALFDKTVADLDRRLVEPPVDDVEHGALEQATVEVTPHALMGTEVAHREAFEQICELPGIRMRGGELGQQRVGRDAELRA